MVRPLGKSLLPLVGVGITVSQAVPPRFPGGPHTAVIMNVG